MLVEQSNSIYLKVLLNLLLADVKDSCFSNFCLLDKLVFWTNPRNSPWQSATVKGFAEVNIVFIVITLEKILLRWLFPSKIYIQFTIFNTYFSTKLSFTKKRQHLHVLEKCLKCYKKSDLSYIFGSLFILFLLVHVAMEQALLSRHISSYLQNSDVTFLSNFYFVSLFYHLFICRIFRIFVDHAGIFSSSPMQHLRWSYLWQKIGNSWKLLLTVVIAIFILNVTRLLDPTLKHIDKFRLAQ